MRISKFKSSLFREARQQWRRIGGVGRGAFQSHSASTTFSPAGGRRAGELQPGSRRRGADTYHAARHVQEHFQLQGPDGVW